MDVIVTPTDAEAWNLTDLLGRSMGRIEKDPVKLFTINPKGHALATMSGMKLGPYPSLDAALAEIEKHTRGVCRRRPGEDRSDRTEGSE